jgi:hypothetical protein
VELEIIGHIGAFIAHCERLKALEEDLGPVKER